MWTRAIILQSPLLIDLLGFCAVGEHGTVKTFIAEMPIETLNERIFPGTARVMYKV